MNVVVLCAGYATRMYPLTRDHPKPLLDVGGRPVLSRLMDRVFTIPGLKHGVLVSNHRFLDRFRAWIDAYGAPIPLTLVDDGSVDENDRLGALRDLALAWDALPAEARRDGVVVVGGDNLIAFDLTGPGARFDGALRPLLLVRRISGDVPPGKYSEVVLDDGGKVVSFREKPRDPRSDLSCICLYFFTPEIRHRLGEYLEGGGNPDAPGHFLEWLNPRMELHAERVSGPWFDIGSIETLEQARRHWEHDS